MIPAFRGTITRRDLSSVLEQLVRDPQDSTDIVKLFSRECARRAGCDYAMALRTEADALRAACFLAHEDPDVSRVLALPVFFSSRSYESLKRDRNLTLVVYDTESNCIDVSEAEKNRMRQMAKKDDVFVFVRKLHFGVYAEQREIDFCTNDTFSSVKVDVCAHPEQYIHQDDVSERNADILIILCERNTLLSSGGGAIVCVRGRKFVRRMKRYEKTATMLPEINAALALAQLRQSNTFIARIKSIMEMFFDVLRGSRHEALAEARHSRSVLQGFPLVVGSRTKEVVRFAAREGVEARRAFDDSLFLLAENYDTPRILSRNEEGRYINASRMASRVLCFPLYPSLDNKEVERLSKVLSSLP